MPGGHFRYGFRSHDFVVGQDRSQPDTLRIEPQQPDGDRRWRIDQRVICQVEKGDAIGNVAVGDETIERGLERRGSDTCQGRCDDQRSQRNGQLRPQPPHLTGTPS